MEGNDESKDKSFESLDFIIKALKSHEQNLDRTINQLATVTDQLRDTTTLSKRLKTIEEKIENLTKQVKKINESF
jgi:ABC-type transporter Mla subunit MlaD